MTNANDSTQSDFLPDSEPLNGNPLHSRWDKSGLGAIDPNRPIQVIGRPKGLTGTPRIRRARLSDCEDGCPICSNLRAEILAGNPPMVLAYD